MTDELIPPPEDLEDQNVRPAGYAASPSMRGVSAMRHPLDALTVYERWTRNRRGMCLWEAQEAYNAPHWYPNAITQWTEARRRHTDLFPPLGAPVFWDSGTGGHGHVAISAGACLVRSSDAGGPGIMGTRPLEWFVAEWYPYGRYLGWTEDLGGVDVSALTPRTWLKRLTYGVERSTSVKNLQRVLNDHPLDGGQTLPVTGNYLAQTDEEVRLCQRQHGYGRDRKRQSFVGVRQARHLRLPGIVT